MRVLIVDDSTAMRMMIRKTLKDAGYEAHDYTEAADGSDALEIVRDTPPDLVLSDWNMPTMNGIDLLKSIQSEGIPTKLGFITTESTIAMRKQANDAGALFVITKPFTVESFQSALDPILG